MKLNQIADAIRRYYDLQAGQTIVHPPAGIVLTQSVDSLLDERLGRVYSMRTTVNAVAAQYQAISLSHPAGLLGVDVTIIAAYLNNVAGGTVIFGVGTSTTSTDRGAGYALDLRDLGGAYRSGAHLTDESSAAALLTASGELKKSSSEACEFFTPITLAPGYLWTFRTGGQNQGISGMIVWRETPVTQRP
jgi:hypothetical protein